MHIWMCIVAQKRINRVYREFDNETGMADWRIFFRK